MAQLLPVTGFRLAIALIALLAPILPGGAVAARPPDAVRIGGPSAQRDLKRAVVVSRSDLRGWRFTVTNRRGRTVLRGKLRRAGGSAVPWKHVAYADLSAIHEPGRYRVWVGRLHSRSWLVTRKPERRAIATIGRFFTANADGEEPSPAHGPAHLNDAEIASGPHAGQRFDLTGGWMDAGDMLKFTSTTAYAAAALQLAATLDPAAAPRLRKLADVGIRWLVKAHPAPDLFVAQVGDARDHELGFRDPASDDDSGKPGIATRLAYPNMGGDLGGATALALALAAARADGEHRAELLRQAGDWYAAGLAADGTAPQLPDLAGDFYVGDTSDDALAAGAAALYRVTGDPLMLDDAASFLAAVSPDGRMGWNSLSGFAAWLLCDLPGNSGPPAVTAREAGCKALQSQARVARARARRSAFGTPGAFTWGQTAENAGGGTLVALAARAGNARRRRVATDARDWLLGRNPWGASFVAGFGPHPPRRIHHWSSLRGPGRPVGAVVGGPAPLADIRGQEVGTFRPGRFDSAAAAYEDRAADYVTSEPALDYAAGSILLLAAVAPRR